MLERRTALAHARQDHHPVAVTHLVHRIDGQQARQVLEAGCVVLLFHMPVGQRQQGVGHGQVQPCAFHHHPLVERRRRRHVKTFQEITRIQ